MPKWRLWLVLFSVAGLCACSSSSSKPPAASTPAAAPVLWGDMKPIVSVKELMRDMLDPASDYIFDAVKIVTTKSGTVESVPKTDEDWAKLRIGATTIAEGVYLLKVPRPFAPAGDENNSTGPEATELSPAQIRAKLEKDSQLSSLEPYTPASQAGFHIGLAAEFGGIH